MDKLKEQIIAKAIEEIEQQNFAITEQLFEIHKVVYKEGKPVIARIDLENEEQGAIVYCPIEGEKFYMAIYVDITPEVEVRWIGTEANFSVYFCGGSETLNAESIISMSNLEPTQYWSKGEKRYKHIDNDAKWRFSKVIYEPNPEPDEFEDKIVKLLDYLERDKEGVRKIVDQYNGYIQVAAMFHNGNSMLGGVHLDVEIMKRLTALNLEIDFDLYAEGNLFKEEDPSWYDED